MESNSKTSSTKTAEFPMRVLLKEISETYNKETLFKSKEEDTTSLIRLSLVLTKCALISFQMESKKHKVLKVKLMLKKCLRAPKIKQLRIRKLRTSKVVLLELMEKLNYLRKNLTSLLPNKRNLT